MLYFVFEVVRFVYIPTMSSLFVIGCTKKSSTFENNDDSLIFVDLLVSTCEKSDGSLICSPSTFFDEVEGGEEVGFYVCMLMFVSSSI